MPQQKVQPLDAVDAKILLKCLSSPITHNLNPWGITRAEHLGRGIAPDHLRRLARLGYFERVGNSYKPTTLAHAVGGIVDTELWLRKNRGETAEINQELVDRLNSSLNGIAEKPDGVQNLIKMGMKF
ncbi:MAG: hypothetical protein KGH98_03795 [Candidatus Micrarchaeota archaeon]|nr:hypothetical protein [Candidatus Micrarchaeota archaeon]